MGRRQASSLGCSALRKASESAGGRHAAGARYTATPDVTSICRYKPKFLEEMPSEYAPLLTTCHVMIRLICDPIPDRILSLLDLVFVVACATDWDRIQMETLVPTLQRGC